MAKEKKKPERVYRVGNVSCSIFVQEGSEDRVFRTVNLRRSYLVGDKREYSASLTLADLPAAKKIPVSCRSPMPCRHRRWRFS